MVTTNILLFNMTSTTDIYTLSLHDALPICGAGAHCNARAVHLARAARRVGAGAREEGARSEEHTSELQSQFHLVCRLLLEKKIDRLVLCFILCSGLFVMYL